MNSLNFENRVFLTRKNEELIRIVEELSSCYAKREEFALKNPHPHLHALHTSEICAPGICFAAAAILVVLLAETVAVVHSIVGCWAKTVPCVYEEATDMMISMVDIPIYRNIV